jgi:hypothetical protein
MWPPRRKAKLEIAWLLAALPLAVLPPALLMHGCSEDEPSATGIGDPQMAGRPAGAVGSTSGSAAVASSDQPRAGGASSDDDPAASGGNAPSSGPVEQSDPDANGQTGSMGSLECTSDQDCAEQAEAWLAPLREASSAHVAPTAGACGPVTVITDRASFSGNACDCAVDGSGGHLRVGPEGTGCLVAGRAHHCLWADVEWDGCDPTDPAACVAVCAELQARRTADAARSFDASLLAAECGSSCRAAVEIDGRCFAGPDWSRTYDCALGAEAILDQAKVEPPKPASVVIPAEIMPYVAGSDGFVQLTVKQRFAGGEPVGAPYFAAAAQFYAPIANSTPMRGEVIEPLDGMDDCGVFRQVSPGTHSKLEWRRASNATMRDGSASVRLPEFVSGELFSYGGAIGRAPRYGERYGIRVEGGQFGSAFDRDALALPLALSIPALEQSSRIDRDALALSWTGSGEAPLRLRVWVKPDPNDTLADVEIICLLSDDGEFTIPADVLQAAPAGMAHALATRSSRMLQSGGGHQLLIEAAIETAYDFTLRSR